MKRVVFIIGLVVLLSVTTGQAADPLWPKTAEAVSGWGGPKKVTLRTDVADPFASETVRSLLDMLLAKKFEVRAVPVDSEIREGLILDYRTGGDTHALILSAAADGTVLAIESLKRVAPAKGSPAEKKTALPSSGMQAAPAGTPERQAGSEETGTVERWMTVPFEVTGEPRRLAFLGTDEEGRILIALHYDDRLDTVRVGPGGIETLQSCSPPLDRSRALYVEAVDPKSGGRPEVAAVWAADRGDIDYGTDSRIHAWVLGPEEREGACRGRSGDLSGYVRSVDDTLYWQEKGAHDPFTGPVRHLVAEKGSYRLATRAPWAGSDLYTATPVSPEKALVWSESGKLQVTDRATGGPLPGGTLLADLGNFTGPAVASRLETPEFRTGMAREDRVLETYRSLARRTSVAKEGTVYTFSRNRTKDIPFLRSPSGSDSLVRVVTKEGPRLERPFPPISAFILDFALIEEQAGMPSAVVLFNEEEDGSGQAFIQVQQAR